MPSDVCADARVQCPWVGNAVGVRNYRDFVGFVFSATLLSGFVGSSCVRGLIDHLIEGKQGVLESGGSPVLGPVMCIVLMLYCALVFFTTLGLLTYHLCLIAKNQTTNEDLKKVYQNVRASTTVLFWLACRSHCCHNCAGRAGPRLWAAADLLLTRFALLEMALLMPTSFGCWERNPGAELA